MQRHLLSLGHLPVGWVRVVVVVERRLFVEAQVACIVLIVNELVKP